MAITEKYCSVAGGGAHDGSSAANAWTLAEAVAGAAAGNRVNIAAGTYTLGASVTFPAGTVAAPIIWRGYNAAIGDLTVAACQSAATLAIDATNFPVIAGGASWTVTAGNYNILEALSLTGSANAVLLVMTGTTQTAILVKVAHSGSGGSVAAVQSGGGNAIINCDFNASNTGASPFACLYVSSGSGTRIVATRLRYAGNNGTSAAAYLGTGAHSLLRCLLIATQKHGVFNNTLSPTTLIADCTIYATAGDAVQGVNGAATGMPLIVNCMVTDSSRFWNNLNSGTSDRPVMRYWNRTRDNANADVGSADWPVYNAVTTDTGNWSTDFAADPSGDTDWRLIAASPATGAGQIPGLDIGALQRVATTGGGAFIGG